MELEHKTVVITGASRGMGQRLAVRLGRERANVVVNFKNDAASADGTVKEVLAAGGDAVAIQADIADPEAVQNLVAGAVDRFGSIDVLVANAAASAFKPLSEIHGRHVAKTMGITIDGFLELVRAGVPHMPSGGRVMAVSGWDSFRVLPGHGLLGAAKAAMETLVKYLAIELGPAGVTTVGVCPGPIDTDSFRIYAGRPVGLVREELARDDALGPFPDAGRGRRDHGVLLLAAQRRRQRPDDRGRRRPLARHHARVDGLSPP